MCTSCGCCEWDNDHGDPRAITAADLEAAAAQAGSDVPTVVANMVQYLAHYEPTHTHPQTAEKTPLAGSDYGVLLKANDEQRVALFVAYPVMKADVARAADGHVDFARKGVVERAAWNWLARGGRLNLWHSEPTDEFEVVESGIHRGPDWVTKAEDGSVRTIVDGDWLAAVRAKTPEAWQLVKGGLIGGASPQGAAKRNYRPDPKTLAALRS